MKTLYLIIADFLDEQTEKLRIGGVETYARDLGLLALSEKFKVVYFQFNVKTKKEIQYEGFSIRFEPTCRKEYQQKFNKIYATTNNNESLFIIMTDQMDISSKEKNVISIQHGIAFDIPGDMIKGFFGKNKTLQHLNKLLRCFKNIHRGYICKNIVCVDYNFYNWFRTLGTFYSDRNVAIIPNYTSDIIDDDELQNKLQKNNSLKKILFARRFHDYRGVFLFANVAKRLLLEESNIEITFAGSGPLESFIRNMFKDEKRVNITQFQASESVLFHKKYDIAVVPTIYSEGTSLSLIEAMGAGCFPIATHVGGMTNVILDHYNGVFCSPNETSLYSVLKKVLCMPKENFNKIVVNAHECAKMSFSLNVWREKWKNLLYMTLNNS